MEAPGMRVDCIHWPGNDRFCSLCTLVSLRGIVGPVLVAHLWIFIDFWLIVGLFTMNHLHIHHISHMHIHHWPAVDCWSHVLCSCQFVADKMWIKHLAACKWSLKMKVSLSGIKMPWKLTVLRCVQSELHAALLDNVTLTLQKQAFDVLHDLAGNMRDWKHLHRYGLQYACLEDGSALCVGAISMPSTISRQVAILDSLEQKSKDMKTVKGELGELGWKSQKFTQYVKHYRATLIVIVLSHPLFIVSNKYVDYLPTKCLDLKTYLFKSYLC